MSDASGSMFPPEWGAMPNDDAPAAERGAYPIVASRQQFSQVFTMFHASFFRARSKRQCARHDGLRSLYLYPGSRTELSSAPRANAHLGCQRVANAL